MPAVPALAALPRLVVLHLTGAQLSGPAWLAVASLHRLTELDASFSTLGDEHVQSLLDLTNLQTLEAAHCPALTPRWAQRCAFST